MSYLHEIHRHHRHEAILTHMMSDVHPTAIAIGLGGSALGMTFAALDPQGVNGWVMLALNTIWGAGWAAALLYRAYRWATAPATPRNWVQPVSDDDMDSWKEAK